MGSSSSGNQMTVEEAVDHIFLHLDKNGDDKLSDLEFVVGAKSSPTVLSILDADKAVQWNNSFFAGQDHIHVFDVAPSSINVASSHAACGKDPDLYL